MGQRGGPNIPLDNLQFAFDSRNPKVSISSYSSIFGDIIAAATGSSVCLGNNFAGQFNFDGTLGTIRVYDRALSAVEIAQIYNASKSRYGL